MIEIRNYEFVTVTGPDTKAFLQGQVTCDIEKLSKNRALAGAICNLKGRVIADFLLVLDGEDCVLRTQSGMAEIIKKTLTKYAIFSKVELSIETRFTKVLGVMADEDEAFLTKIIDALRWPYGIILLLFLISVLGIQIGTLVDHRRGRYGIFLAKGVNWIELYQMLYIQIGFALIIGAGGASIIIAIVKSAVSKVVSSTTQEFQDTLSTTNFEILPLEWADYTVVIFSAFLLAQCFATFILYRLPIHARTEIGPMLQN